MVNMANLPQGKEFSWKGGVKSIARGKERSFSGRTDFDFARI